jgi:hypothetical protein
MRRRFSAASLESDQRDAVFSAAAGVSLFKGSPFPLEPLPVNCRIKSSIGFELPVLSWRLIPAFSLRIRL